MNISDSRQSAGAQRPKVHPTSSLALLLEGISAHWILYALVLVLGIAARTWEFNSLPPGLIADEPSIGVDAYDVYRYGIDRNGVSFPLHFISYGPGQNAIYGYLLIPFIALYGLKPWVVRLPMLISGILSMPLLCMVGRLTFGRRVGLVMMFFLAICPWRIMLSRLCLESNFFPLIFLLACTCLLLCLHDNRWFIASGALFALCLFAYGPSYLIVPLVFGIGTWLLHRRRLIGVRYILAGLGTAAFVG